MSNETLPYDEKKENEIWKKSVLRKIASEDNYGGIALHQLCSIMNSDEAYTQFAINSLFEENLIKEDGFRHRWITERDGREYSEKVPNYRITQKGEVIVKETEISCTGRIESDEAKLFYGFVCAMEKPLGDYNTFKDVMVAYDAWIRTGAILEGKSCLKV